MPVTIENRKMQMMAAIWTQVFTLPDHAAAMTCPLAAATLRRLVMMNSRARMMKTIHAGNSRRSAKRTSAAVTSSLSASGSTNLPKSVT